ncbi:zinc-binding alcohol dehydrogenase family protein [Apilactobacillus timberlakei]|uniref:zinc-binding alcohol dehydrogenase family protein n=1 Tax=Apilactobacillus timberlakei TaxID=2008380 RepID=UPI00112A862D|nr:zinc-binding alcohol dehydrogenase family protein [Apilactobacillus timberlakei]TPR15018.1 zinc-binding alcohol dehydrogenase family protein [Apilactobacillus timberlakei]
MKAIGFNEFLPIENPNSLFDFNTLKPVPRENDLIVKVDAVSVNPVDMFTRRGQHKKTSEPKIIGYDAYGTVVRIGSKVDLFNVGDKVFYAGAYDRPGSNSEYQAVDEKIVGHAPTKLSSAEIAAMPLTSLTAWESLFEQMHIDFENHDVNKDKTILIINGAGGVGSIATQLAHLAGLTVIATAGKKSTAEWELKHGADYIVNHHEDIVDQIHEIGYKSVDNVLELSNLDHYWHIITKLIAPFGHIVSTTGSGKNLNFKPLKSRMVSFGWEWMYAKSWYQTDNMITQHIILEKISELLDSGAIKSTLTKNMSPINAKQLRIATKYIETNNTIGKIAITD